MKVGATKNLDQQFNSKEVNLMDLEFLSAHQLADYATIQETAVIAGVSTRTVQRWLAAGKLTAYRSPIDWRRYVLRSELAAKLVPVAVDYKPAADNSGNVAGQGAAHVAPDPTVETDQQPTVPAEDGSTGWGAVEGVTSWGTSASGQQFGRNGWGN